MTHKLAASLTPGDVIRYEARTCEVILPPAPGARFLWMCHVDLRDTETNEVVTATYIASERVALVEVR